MLWSYFSRLKIEVYNNKNLHSICIKKRSRGFLHFPTLPTQLPTCVKKTQAFLLNHTNYPLDPFFPFFSTFVNFEPLQSSANRLSHALNCLNLIGGSITNILEHWLLVQIIFLHLSILHYDNRS